MSSREHVITIKGTPAAADDKRQDVVRPSRRAKSLARRVRDFRITLYDLAQKNVGTAEAPVWADHDILKTPAYTLTETNPANLFSHQGVTFTIDEFTQSDFDAYTQMFFDVAPVEQWANTYRPITVAMTQDGRNPDEFYARNKFTATYPESGFHTSRIVDRYADRSTPTGKALAKTYKDEYGFAWTTNGLEYKGLDEITVSYYFTINGGGSTVEDIFLPLSTAPQNRWTHDDQEDFKVTTTLDPDAPDVAGTFDISGNIDCYLMPQIGLFMATAEIDPPVYDSVFIQRTGKWQTLGPWYQITPRKNWPGHGLIVQADADAYFNYVKTRTGAQASEWYADWIRSSYPGGSVTGYDLVQTPIDPSDWDYTGATQWYHQMDNQDLNAGAFTQARLNGLDSRYEHFGHLLTAVLKIRNRFYYVWTLPHVADEFGDIADNIGAYMVNRMWWYHLSHANTVP